ncbi:MAG: S8 family serine peptidase [Gemmatimonadota bacterium]|nr:S8 family serine peptidase [Gemmatimonadota bacterium]
METKKRTTTTRKKASAGTGEAPEAGLNIPDFPATESFEDDSGVETTGRFIVIFKEGATSGAAAIRSTLNKVAGLREVTSSSDYAAGQALGLHASEAFHFEKLGIVVMSGEDAMMSLSASTADADSPILSIEPEYIARLSDPLHGEFDLRYLRGYRDAVNHLYDRLSGGGEAAEQVGHIEAILQDTAQFTWGLQATGASTSRHNGQGIKVAVLDTGFDLHHPDFIGRNITSETFSGFPVQDIHGHGTHCVGTACGPLSPASGVRRYGVATAAQIFVGKVFNNDTRPGAATGDVVAGIEWAITNGCRIVSLSLGVPMNQQIQQYSEPIRRALEAGTLVVCAAGNNANRQGLPGFDSTRQPTLGFVEPPANADHSMAVAAVDNQMRIAAFSARSSQVTGSGGKVNIAGPGVAVFSSVPTSRGRHASFNGTSMATPHVAGIAALWAQAEGLSGMSLWNRLIQSARALSLASADAGSGLVQAPQ